MNIPLVRAIRSRVLEFRSECLALASGDDPIGARTLFNSPQRWALLVAFASILVFRLPNAWAYGRFQDEEATVFLAYAWHRPWFDALFRPFAGYWNLAANATTLVVARLVQSGIVPLERGPYLTMTAALAVQLLPATLILNGRAPWLGSRLAVIAALLMIAIMPATEEVFFNVLHIQFHLALCVAIILALDVPRGRLGRLGYGALLFVAPLCGVAAIILLPLFALRAWIDRDLGRLKQLAALAAGAAVQLLLFYHSTPLRGHLFDPPTLAAALFVRLVTLPLAGVNVANQLGAMIYDSRVGGGALSWSAAVASVVLFGTLIVLAAKRRDAAIWLILSALVIASVSLGFGMVGGERYRLPNLFGAVEGERYNFLPLVLLGLSLIVLAMRPAFEGRSIFAALCALFLLTGVIYYPKALTQFADGPSWSAEVEAWRSDHRHPLAVWPTPWAADLSDESPPCPLPSRDPARLRDPRYCESGWLAPFYDRK